MSLVVQRRQTDNVTILSCSGRIATPEDANQLLEAYRQSVKTTQHVIVNLERLSIFGSLGVGALILLHHWASSSGRQFKVAGSAGLVHEILEMSRLTDLLSIYTHEDQALAALAASAA
jgi:anti-anti-sigma factor